MKTPNRKSPVHKKTTPTITAAKLAAQAKEIESLQTTVDELNIRLLVDAEVVRQCANKQISELTRTIQLTKTNLEFLYTSNVKFDCQFTISGTPNPRCGKCPACQLKQTRHILSQTADNLKKANAERDLLKTNYETKLKNLGELERENYHLRVIRQLLFVGLQKAYQANLFTRAKIIQHTLTNVMTYHSDNNMSFSL